MADQTLNVKQYKELLEKHGLTRHKLDHDLWRRYHAVRQVFALTYAVPRKLCDFKFMADLDYYEGGYPLPSSPAKLDVFVRQVATTFLMWSMLGRTDDLNKRLAVFGCRLVDTKDNHWPKPTCALKRIPLDAKGQKKVARAWKRAFGDKAMPTKDADFLGALLAEAEKLQHEICQLADTIKINGADEAKAKHGIEKGNFKLAVTIEASKLAQKKRKDSLLSKVKDKRIKNLTRAIIPFENEK